MEEEWTGGLEMAGDMWDRGLEEGDFASLRQFIKGLPEAKWRCWGWVEWSRVKYYIMSSKKLFFCAQKSVLLNAAN